MGQVVGPLRRLENWSADIAADIMVRQPIGGIRARPLAARLTIANNAFSFLTSRVWDFWPVAISQMTNDKKEELLWLA